MDITNIVKPIEVHNNDIGSIVLGELCESITQITKYPKTHAYI